MRPLAMFVETLSVIADRDHDGAVGQAARVEPLQHPADLVIDKGDLSSVRAFAKLDLNGSGGIGTVSGGS